jgi:hypothetical protein
MKEITLRIFVISKLEVKIQPFYREERVSTT